MPIELGIWRIDGNLKRVHPEPLDNEERLEVFLEQDPSLIDPALLIIGRQVLTSYGKYIDLLAINSEGELVVVELKRDRTPRDVVAQVLDYGSWIKDLNYDDVKDIYEEYAYATTRSGPGKFEEAFAQHFGNNPPESINEAHQLIIVAAQLDSGSERIIRYLTQDYGVPVNAIFFRYFHDGSHEYLTRTWLQDPKVVDTASSKGKSKKEDWNGRDFYVSFGDGDHRRWEDAMKYGFIAGGQGLWYSKTLKMLEPGHRIFVHIPSVGYVGVGEVIEEALPVQEFTVHENGHSVPILQVENLQARDMHENAGDPEKSEYLVRVDWIKVRTKSQAYWETGLFANQNTVCRLRNKFTLEKLQEHFGLEE